MKEYIFTVSDGETGEVIGEGRGRAPFSPAIMTWKGLRLKLNREVALYISEGGTYSKDDADVRLSNIASEVTGKLAALECLALAVERPDILQELPCFDVEDTSPAGAVRGILYQKALDYVHELMDALLGTSTERPAL